jgi:class 3 adenylate cyclase
VADACPLRVRVALHTGPAYLSHGDYFGTTVNRVARLLAVTHGGQTLLTSKTEALVRDSLPASSSLHDTGMLRLRDLPHPMHVFQFVHPGLSPSLLELGDASGGNKLRRSLWPASGRSTSTRCRPCRRSSCRRSR